MDMRRLLDPDNSNSVFDLFPYESERRFFLPCNYSSIEWVSRSPGHHGGQVSGLLVALLVITGARVLEWY